MVVLSPASQSRVTTSRTEWVRWYSVGLCLASWTLNTNTCPPGATADTTLMMLTRTPPLCTKGQWAGSRGQPKVLGATDPVPAVPVLLVERVVGHNLFFNALEVLLYTLSPVFGDLPQRVVDTRARARRGHRWPPRVAVEGTSGEKRSSWGWRNRAQMGAGARGLGLATAP